MSTHAYRTFYGADKTLKFNDDGTIQVTISQDMEAIIDHCKMMRDHASPYVDADREIKRVGFIPITLRQKILNEQGWDMFDVERNQDRLVKFFNDPDYVDLRTAYGVIGYSNGVMR